MTSKANSDRLKRHQRRAAAIFRALAAIAADQTAAMMKQARRIVVEKRGKPEDLKAIHEAEIKKAIKHAMLEAFKKGRVEGKARRRIIARQAPDSVRELEEAALSDRQALVQIVLAEVRELDDDALRYAEVAAEYERWADELIGGTLKDTVRAGQEVIAEGIREGVPWNDYGWDKELGRYTQEGLKTRLAKVFTDYETWQMKRVAITEHTRAVGLGNIYDYSRDKKVVGTKWIVEYTGCPICNPRNGQVFALQTFLSIHPAHPNCQCVPDPVFEWEMKREEVLTSWDQ
jgi:hypothetical protein